MRLPYTFYSHKIIVVAISWNYYGSISLNFWSMRCIFWGRGVSVAVIIRSLVGFWDLSVEIFMSCCELKLLGLSIGIFGSYYLEFLETKNCYGASI